MSHSTIKGSVHSLVCTEVTQLEQKDIDFKATKDTLDSTITRIDKNVCEVDGKIECVSTRSKLMYSECVKTG